MAYNPGMDDPMNPAEFLFKLSSDIYGVENLDAEAFMDAIAMMEEEVDENYKPTEPSAFVPRRPSSWEPLR